MRTALSLAALPLLALSACTGTADSGDPVDGDATVTPDCAPDDGSAYSFDIGLDDGACDAVPTGSWLRVVLWANLDPMAGSSWDLDPASGLAQVQLFVGDGSTWLTQTGGTFTVDTWTSDGATGSFDVFLEDGTHLTDEFDALYCDAAPMCG